MYVLCRPMVIGRFYFSVFQLAFEIFRTVASFIKISSGHSLIIKLIFIKFFRTIWEIGEQMSRDQCLAESLLLYKWYLIFTRFSLIYYNSIQWTSLSFTTSSINPYKLTVVFVGIHRLFVCFPYLDICFRLSTCKCH